MTHDWRKRAAEKIAEALQASPQKAAAAAELLNEQELDLVLTSGIGRVAIATVIYKARCRGLGQARAAHLARQDHATIVAAEEPNTHRANAAPADCRKTALPVPPGCQHLLQTCLE